jgi:hypothetical protein
MSGGVPNDTWAWDGRTWTRLAASGQGPPGYEFSGMAWDDAHQQMVLVTPPASGAGTAPAATWTWSGDGWTQRMSPRAPPAAQNTLAFDPATRSVLLFVAGTSEGAAASTWSWDGSAWQELHPLTEPTSLGPTFMTAVPGSKRLMLVTANVGGDGPDTWTWDGEDWTPRQDLQWTALASGIAGLAEDASGAVIAFGAGSAGPLSAAWAWTGMQWVRLAMTFPAPPVDRANHPPPRQFASTAYDERHNQLVLFGGNAEIPPGTSTPSAPSSRPSPPTFDADTWTFDGQRWTRSTTPSHPPSTGSMAFDAVTGSVILVADANGSGFTGPGLARPVTWSWDGHTWHELHPSSELPLGTVPTAMVADPATRTVVAVAICCQNSSGTVEPPQSQATWVWNGRGWLNPHPRVDLGSGVVRLAYDTASQRVLATLSDGSSNGVATTWAWDGSTWTELHPTSDAIVDPVTEVMAGDPSTGTVVLLERTFQDVSGANAGGTLVWDGTTWTDHYGLALPEADTAYGDAALYIDPGLGRLVLLSSTSHDFSQEWMWTGVAWLQLAMA